MELLAKDVAETPSCERVIYVFPKG
ncbi:hypothetical protein Ccrd_017710, partial [Cynara cardunculus var. scolymus]